VAPDAADGAWSTEVGNEEIASVDEVLATLEEAGVLSPGLPTLVIGHSNGGAFSQVYALGSERDVVAAVNENGWGTAALRAGNELPPMIFVGAENDTIVNANVVTDAATAAASRGHAVQALLHRRVALTPERFTRIEGIDEGAAAELLDAFREAGIVDASGLVVRNPRGDARIGRATPGPLREFSRHIDDQMHVAYAEHRFSSAEIEPMFELFDAAVE
jgi:pimeloyl-ACP methyl ester carboxylesterase